MEKFIENKNFYLRVIYICSFASNGALSDLWDGIQHG